MKKRQFKKYVKDKLHINTGFKSSLEKKQYMHNLKIWNKLCFNGQDDSNVSNSLVLGKSIPSNVYHPWDNLKVCKKCGTYPFMEGKYGRYESGSPYRILCIHCGRKTEFYSNVQLLKQKWSGIN